MIDYKDEEAERLQAKLKEHSRLSDFSKELLKLYELGWQKILRHGDLKRWHSGFSALPNITLSNTDLNLPAIKIGNPDDSSMTHLEIEKALKKMHPWRKGPFELFGVYIDTEWRSDWKWERLKKSISPLEGRTVLDVGCGSGYHMWRMLGADAELVIGIDPTPLFSMHFATIKRYIPSAPAFLLPVGIEQMPTDIACFDTIFSMGVLYHRKSPIDHLIELKNMLTDGGELVIDTLVIKGDESRCLIPHGRYAKMRNVWFIPTVGMLSTWLKRVGFKHIDIIDVTQTTSGEQRSTSWMTFESLSDFLDPDNPNQTIEGYPAPVRAALVARV